jgi:hypothetical protein
MYRKALGGDVKAARNLIYARHDYAYEDFEILEVCEK